MFEQEHIKSVSFRLLLIAGLIYISDIFTNGLISSYLSLQPTRVLENLELWRLISFPFARGTVEGTLLFLVVFYLYGPKLEEILNHTLYSLILILVTILQGTILTLVYLKSSSVLSGMEGLSFFVMLLFTFFKKGKRLYVWLFKPIKTVILTSIIFILWGTSMLIHSLLIIDGHHLLINGVLSAFIGFVSAGISFLQIRATRNLIKARLENKELVIPKPEELTPAIIGQNELRKFSQSLREEPSYYGDFKYTEDRLNEILDKINDFGKESLTHEEKLFLEGYSKNIE
jgi:membrane associated rhomboid family serine protease